MQETDHYELVGGYLLVPVRDALVDEGFARSVLEGDCLSVLAKEGPVVDEMLRMVRSKAYVAPEGLVARVVRSIHEGKEVARHDDEG